MESLSARVSLWEFTRWSSAQLSGRDPVCGYILMWVGGEPQCLLSIPTEELAEVIFKGWRQ